MATSSIILKAEKLNKSFGQTKALRGLGTKIRKGGITAILGNNGAGKTTLIRCALGLARSDGGTLDVFNGRPGRLAARRRIGAMLQASDLPDLLTPREHITLFSSYYANPLPARELIALCGLEDFVDKRYKTLSGGQKRRTQFALAIAGRPDLVFLDEPTSGLDTEARRKLWDTVRALSAAGTSIILTTHYLEEADALADRIIVMASGKIIADGPPEEIRGAAGGAVIRCVTSAPIDALAQLPGVKQASPAGRYVELVTRSAPESLKALFALDEHPSDLTVTKPDLEDAVRDLVGALAKGD